MENICGIVLSKWMILSLNLVLAYLGCPAVTYFHFNGHWVVTCWHGYLSGVRYRLACGPADATVSCFSKIQIGFTFLVPADLGSSRKRAVKRVFVFFSWAWISQYASFCLPSLFSRRQPLSVSGVGFCWTACVCLQRTTRRCKTSWHSWKTRATLWTCCVTNTERNDAVNRRSWRDCGRFRWHRSWRCCDRKNRSLLMKCLNDIWHVNVWVQLKMCPLRFSGNMSPNDW